MTVLEDVLLASLAEGNNEVASASIRAIRAQQALSQHGCIGYIPASKMALGFANRMETAFEAWNIANRQNSSYRVGILTEAAVYKTYLEATYYRRMLTLRVNYSDAKVEDLERMGRILLEEYRGQNLPELLRLYFRHTPTMDSKAVRGMLAAAAAPPEGAAWTSEAAAEAIMHEALKLGPAEYNMGIRVLFGDYISTECKLAAGWHTPECVGSICLRHDYDIKFIERARKALRLLVGISARTHPKITLFACSEAAAQARADLREQNYAAALAHEVRAARAAYDSPAAEQTGAGPAAEQEQCDAKSETSETSETNELTEPGVLVETPEADNAN